MIAVTFALPNESSEFVRLIVNGRLHGHEVQVVHTGVGERAANHHLRNFLDKNLPRLKILISAGFAGALRDELSVGDLFTDENLTHPNLLGFARSIPNLHTGKLTTAADVIDSFPKRAELARLFRVMAVDMETESIAGLCKHRNIPMLSLRAISDTPSAPFGIPMSVLFDLEEQRTNLPTLLGYLIRHPRSIAQLSKIARQVKKARQALTAGLDQLFRAMPNS